ncbi:recombinase family protein [Vibrio hannami]|uniref:recombinase family protein n=1 Tax=Vibrio hannami TaxID=2717094 RepID=UPI00240F1AE4|nr:recombinase family protein [Vibrio hannami]MDG3085633.1 recombinase family protein [Vibrio hannami]
MSDANAYGYIRFSPKNPNFDDEVASIGARLPEVKLFKEVRIKGFVPAAERPQLQEMLNILKAGDAVVIWWIDSLGCHFGDVKQTIEEILNKGAKVITINQKLMLEANNPETTAQLNLLEGIAKAEKRRRLAFAEASRRALKENPEEWAKRYKGRQANQALHHQIATLLLEGKTLQATADETGASLSTVKRVKSKIKHKGDMSELRVRD